jgi:hypothetical protein
MHRDAALIYGVASKGHDEYRAPFWDHLQKARFNGGYFLTAQLTSGHLAHLAGDPNWPADYPALARSTGPLAVRLIGPPPPPQGLAH